MVNVVRKPSRVAAALLVAGTSALVAGCGVTSLTSGLGTSIFGGSSSQAAAPSGVSEAELLAAAKAGGGPVTQANFADPSPGCPGFKVWSRDRHITVYEPGRVGDGLAIVHRGELTKTARECSTVGNRVTVRYGFAGRVLLGPRGQSGPLSLPITVFASDENKQKIAQEQLRVDATVAVENPIGYFSAVRTITFDVPVGSRAGDFDVYVGFERTAATATPAPPPLAGRRPPPLATSRPPPLAGRPPPGPGRAPPPGARGSY